MDAVVENFIYDELQGSRHAMNGKTVRVFFDGDVAWAKEVFRGLSTDVGFPVDGCIVLNLPHESNHFQSVNIEFTLK